MKRLKVLVQLRKLYRNLLRAERLLSTSSPVHQKPEEVKPSKGGACLPAMAFTTLSFLPAHSPAMIMVLVSAQQR